VGLFGFGGSDSDDDDGGGEDEGFGVGPSFEDILEEVLRYHADSTKKCDSSNLITTATGHRTDFETLGKQTAH